MIQNATYISASVNMNGTGIISSQRLMEMNSNCRSFTWEAEELSQLTNHSQNGIRNSTADRIHRHSSLALRPTTGGYSFHFEQKILSKESCHLCQGQGDDNTEMPVHSTRNHHHNSNIVMNCEDKGLYFF